MGATQAHLKDRGRFEEASIQPQSDDDPFKANRRQRDLQLAQCELYLFRNAIYKKSDRDTRFLIPKPLLSSCESNTVHDTTKNPTWWYIEHRNLMKLSKTRKGRYSSGITEPGVRPKRKNFHVNSVFLERSREAPASVMHHDV